MRPCLLLITLLAAPVLAQDGPFISNGGFEEVREATPGVAGWTLADPPLVPAGWSLNVAYPGELVMSAEGPRSGERHARITAPPGGSAHLYQMCAGLERGTWYRVSAWVRGGAVSVMFYEYYPDRIDAPTVVQVTVPSDEWRLLTAFYQPAGEGYLRSALAIAVPPGQTVDVDDVSIERLDLPDVPPEGADITLETDLLRLVIAGNGMLREFSCKASGTDYGPGPVPLRILGAARDGIPVALHSITREGDLLHAQFLDPEVKAALRVTARPLHLHFEVVSVEPDDVSSLSLEFPVRRLETVATAFNATYDDEFGACLFGTTVNVYNRPASRGQDVWGLGAGCGRKRGMVGAGFALVAAPYERFAEAIMEAERESGLPCPMLEGEWARFSEPVRRSYLFMVDVTEDNIDRIIEYAQIGNFGMIIFLKNNWLANHGHFDINTANFPEGRASLKRAVEKVHAAGMGCGVHVFGPSISPNDPYVTPVPDDRLAFVPVPPLAEAVDETATTLVVATEPDLPPKTPSSRAHPGNYIRLGDEIIRYGSIEGGPPWRFVNCARGALGTTATAHPAGAEIRGLLTTWGFFLVDPDSTLADELTSNFADVFNECDFDMVYFDASDGTREPYMETWYYLNKLHLGFYSKFHKDVLYQTSMGTGSNILWHMVPRSASADGHGDIKGYLDQRLATMQRMAANWTKPDVGWYYMYQQVRPDQIEYVLAKMLGLDGSVSIQTSLAALHAHPRARQMMEMIGAYEQCRLERHFPASVREKLQAPGADFKLFRNGDGWELYRAVYEEPRIVEVLDGQENAWTIINDLDEPVLLGVEITRGARAAASADYDAPGAVTIEAFDDEAPYRMSEFNQYEKFVVGGGKVLTEAGPVRAGVTQSFTISAEGARIGDTCAVYAAENTGEGGGWCGIGRRFETPLDLGGHEALALWMHGDGKGQAVRFQLWDTRGRVAQWVPVINYTGWRMHAFATADARDFDWSQVEYLLFYFNNIPAQTSVEVRLDEVRAIPALTERPTVRSPGVTVNGETVTFPVTLEPAQALTCAGPEGVMLWPGGMEQGRRVDVSTDALMLQPGENRVVFSSDAQAGYAGDVTVLLYRLWRLEE